MRRTSPIVVILSKDLIVLKTLLLGDQDVGWLLVIVDIFGIGSRVMLWMPQGIDLIVAAAVVPAGILKYVARKSSHSACSHHDEAHKPFDWSKQFAQAVVEGNQFVFGNEDPITWE